MQAQPETKPPEYVTSFFRGRPWPPNRTDKVSKHTLAAWLQMRPGINSISSRAKPEHFRRAFALLGWREACFYYRCSWRVLCRWVNEDGKDECIAERLATRKQPNYRKLRASMAATYFCEPRDPAWAR